MASMINIITGALTKPVILRTLPDGRSVADLNFAVDVRVGSGANAENITQWTKVSVFGGQADAAKANLTKGSIVTVSVRNLRRRTYTKTDGTEGESYEGVADSLSYISNFGSKFVAENEDGADSSGAGNQGASNVDDIPF